MPDDCPVDDESRRALRDLARRAEWTGRPGAAGAAADARTLRELGREIEIVLARDPRPHAGQGSTPGSSLDPDHDHDHTATWAYRASASLAAYCQRAQPNWTPEQIVELGRLRDDATTALAPGPGETEADLDPNAAKSRRPGPLSSIPVIGSLGRALGTRRPAVLALAAVSCLVLIALVLTLPHVLGGNSAQTPTASSTTSAPPATPTTPPTATDSATDTSTASSSAGGAPSTSTSASASVSTSTSTSSADNSHVTGIQITNTDDLPGSPPEVIVNINVNASGTGDVTINFTITGSSGQPQVSSLDESGASSYSQLTEQINLSQWCGQSSVLLTVSSGSISQTANVAVSGC